ncbi:TPA: hypothetical protein N0F65_001415 [Lagenidium giganteum]|uniref:Uncharacterized protein n=1 Tax=Lagenidium giganteum TaxID=4803 RepID=A0AAV2YY24_9STRA|nr:TPA: hypothetical protein N0F65_001415 [Lagenidium giganteum]
MGKPEAAGHAMSALAGGLSHGSGNGSSQSSISSVVDDKESAVQTASPTPVPPRGARRARGAMPVPSSPVENRAKREAFPRAALWKWNHSLAGGHPEKKDDLIEKMLRECAPTLAIPSGTQQPGGQPNGSPERRGQGSISSSKRKLGKKDTQTVLRTSMRHITGKELDGWMAYKVAHRTNKFMAKTRKAIEVLAKEQKEGVFDKQDSQSMIDDDEEEEAPSPGLQKILAVFANKESRGQRPVLNRTSTAMQMFEREVLNASEDDEPQQQQQQSPRAPADDAGPPDGGQEFWDIYKSITTNKRPDSPRGRYIGDCEDASLLVLPVLDLKKKSRYDHETKSLRYDNYYFGDQRAEAFGDALQLMPVQVKQLSMKNVGITGSGSAAIVDGLAMHKLNHLNFAENRIGPKGTIKIFKSLQDPHVNLKTLDLGNNHLGDQCVKQLVQCLVNRCTLEHLDLRRNEIFHAAKAIGELLRISTPLKSLNLSWNNIRGEPAQHLARCMMENLTLTHLDLADNTLGNNGNADAELGACLATNKSLKYLNVSNNHIHGKSMLVYVNGLQQNTVLESLVVRGNPIGSLGTEAILRAVACSSVTKCELDIGECNVEIQEAMQQTLIYSGGVYSLSLADRADSVLLRELLLLYAKNKSEIIEASFNGLPYSFTKKDEKSLLHSIPSSGVMQLKVQPNFDRHEELMPDTGFEHVMRLMSKSFGHLRDGDEAAKLFCIRLLAEEYCFTVAQANSLLSLFKSHTAQVEKANAAAALIPQILTKNFPHSAHEIYDCASMETPREFFEDKDQDGKIDVCGDICMVIGLTNLSDLEQAHVEKKVGKWISFNVNNATGHYRLNMSNPIDRRILMRILEVNKTDKKMRQQLKLMDSSQFGSSQPQLGGFRNVKLNHVPLPMDSSWQFPRMGVLEFDFVAARRPYSICTALNDAAFEKFLREFKQLDVPAEVKLIGLRSISTSYYFTNSQTQRIMEHFGTFERDPETGALFRAEVFIILFNRIIDEWNFVETLGLLDLTTKKQVVDRLGYLNCFHPLQIAESYDLNLAFHDQRQLLLTLVKLAIGNEFELSCVVLNNESDVEHDEWKLWVSEDKLPPLPAYVSCSVRALQPVQSESLLPPNSYRKKLMQTLHLKLESKAHEIL